MNDEDRAKLGRKPHTYATCLGCGWVHFSVSKDQALKEIYDFLYWVEKQSTETQQNFGTNGFDRDTEWRKMWYDKTHCFFCRNYYKNFRDFEESDCPDGVTIQGILTRHE